MTQLATIASKLVSASEQAHGVDPGIDFPDQVGRRQWFMSPELISIYNSPTWHRLDEAQRQILSFWEAVNFFSINIHGEAALIEGLEVRIGEPEFAPVANYLRHFMDEEHKHTAWFREFCLRYAGKVYPNRHVLFPRPYEPGEAVFLFFARVVIFEEIVDGFNATMARDHRLATVARIINSAHHSDERRHLAFGRVLLTDLWRKWQPEWDAATQQSIQAYLGDYLDGVWREYYNASVYVDSGLSEAPALAATAWASESARVFRAQQSRRCLSVLATAGILPRSSP